MRSPRFFIISALAVCAILGKSSPASALVRAGGASPVTVTNQFFMALVSQNPTDSVTVQTANLSSGGDTVIHVQNASDPNGAFIAGDDDFNGQLSSFVFIPATGTARTLRVVVRSFNPSSAGTCDVTINTPSNGTSSFFGQHFGGTPFSTTMTLEANTHVQTVELRNTVTTFTDTVMLVVSGNDESHAVAFNDDGAVGAPGGVGLMSYVQLPEQCPAGFAGCQIILADFRSEAPITTRLVYDSDVGNGFDADGDGLGDTLENSIGTLPNLWDTDSDGISDSEEFIGVEISKGVYPPIKFPLMGADPINKDIFVEEDWQACTVAAKCGTNLDAAQMQQADVAQLKADFFQTASGAPPGVRVHFDIGIENDDPNTWFDWGNWGGAQRVTPDDPNNPPFCLGLSEERAGFFHHQLLSETVGGHAPVDPDWPHKGQIVSACSVAERNHRTSGHELGHNLGLGHGGRPQTMDMNVKTHYLSMMNYAYEREEDSFITGFSWGKEPSHGITTTISLTPTALDEHVGMGANVDAAFLTFLQTKDFVYKVQSDSTKPNYRAVDWNRDGVFAAAGTTVRASITQAFGYDTGFDSSTNVGAGNLGGSFMLRNPSFTWVSPGGSIGDQLFIFGRKTTDSSILYDRISRSFMDAGCNTPFLSLTEGAVDCAGLTTQTANLNITGAPGPAPFAPAAADLGGGKFLLVVPKASPTNLVSSVATVNSSTGAVSFAAPVTLPGAPTMSGDVAAVAVAAGKIVAWAIGTDHKLKQWTFQSNAWTGPVDQLLTTNVAINPRAGAGIGATVGFDGTNQFVYAAIPQEPDGTVLFARQEASGANAGKWTDLTSSAFSQIVPSSGAIRTNDRPGCSYQRTAGGAVTAGRFYFSWSPGPASFKDSSGAYRTEQMMTMTEGNLPSTGTDHRLMFLHPWMASNAPATGGIALVSDVNRDSNLRMIRVTNALLNFSPLGDGIANAAYKDENDYTYLTGNLAASLGQGSQLP